MKVLLIWKNKPDTVMEFPDRDAFILYLKENRSICGWMIIEKEKKV